MCFQKKLKQTKTKGLLKMNNRITVKHNSFGGDLLINPNTLPEGVSVARCAADILAKRRFGKYGIVTKVFLCNTANDGGLIEYEIVIVDQNTPDIDHSIKLILENEKID